jgi:hypothetical protein
MPVVARHASILLKECAPYDRIQDGRLEAERQAAGDCQPVSPPGGARSEGVQGGQQSQRGQADHRQIQPDQPGQPQAGPVCRQQGERHPQRRRDQDGGVQGVEGTEPEAASDAGFLGVQPEEDQGCEGEITTGCQQHAHRVERADALRHPAPQDAAGTRAGQQAPGVAPQDRRAAQQVDQQEKTFVWEHDPSLK